MIKQVKKYNGKDSVAYIVSDVCSEQIESLKLSKDERNYVNGKLARENFAMLNLFDSFKFFVFFNPENNIDSEREQVRKAGCAISDKLNAEKLSALNIVDLSGCDMDLAMAEGVALSNYRFNKYKGNGKEVSLTDIKIVSENKKSEIEKLNAIVRGVFYARDITNEPLSYMTAQKLSEEVERIGKECGFRTEILGKKQIESLKMGGLLAVNRGSIEPPTFSILKWEPENAINDNPYVLVGKGLVFDTGGYNLKPTSSMSTMKSDKAGGAAVVGTIAALALAKVPIKVYGLIPATENRIGATAYVPEDIITMFDGTTIEINNTDAEGRLILADALSYASKYEPKLVIDMATLTGAAISAVGEKNTAILGTEPNEINKMKECGFNVWERVIELPLWDDFADLLKSSVADMKNSGGRSAGTISAAMFLKHFTNYPWIHLDIAGPAFVESKDSYRGNGATAVPTRMLFSYFDALTAGK